MESLAGTQPTLILDLGGLYDVASVDIPSLRLERAVALVSSSTADAPATQDRVNGTIAQATHARMETVTASSQPVVLFLMEGLASASSATDAAAMQGDVLGDLDAN